MLAASALLAAIAANPPQQVILVADVGVDDAAGVLLALSSPSLEVLGIAATFGCHKHVEVTARNAERLLAAANRSSVPVYRGAPFPFGSTDLMHGDGSYVHGADGFGNLPDDYESCSPAETGGVSAAEFIAQTARSAPGKVVLVSFSPLTNVALALAIEPRLPTLLRSMVAMGGAIYCAGNASPLAEANFMHDAHAARIVVHAFAQAGSLVLAPLDVTNPTIIAPRFIEQMSAGGKAAAMFTSAWPTYQNAYCKLAGECDGTPLHDAHPVMYLVAPQLYTRTEQLKLSVISSQVGDPAHGMSTFDRRGKRADTGLGGGREAGARGSVTVLLGVDRRAFVKLLADSISGLARLP